MLWGRHFEAASVPGEASRQACHAGGRAGRATQSRAVRGFRTPTAAKTGGVARKTACSTSSCRRKVEQAARLAMPAAAPAEEHNPERRGASERRPPPRLAAWPARLRAPPEGVARKTACSTSNCRRKVEHAAKLGMPVVAPAEEHNPERRGASERRPPPRLAAWPAGLRAPPQAAAAPLRIYNWVRTKRRRDRRGERSSCCPGGEIGRRKGLKILWGATLVRVQVPPRAPEPAAATPQRKTASRLRRGLEWLTKSPRPFELGSAGS